MFLNSKILHTSFPLNHSLWFLSTMMLIFCPQMPTLHRLGPSSLACEEKGKLRVDHWSTRNQKTYNCLQSNIGLLGLINLIRGHLNKGVTIRCSMFRFTPF